MSQRKDLIQMELIPQTSSVAGSHAKTYQQPKYMEKDQESMEADQDCFLNCCELLAKLDQNTWSWKMSQGCLLETMGSGSGESFLNWNRSGIAVNGIAYMLPVLVPSIKGIESGLLPTPTARDYKDGKKPFYRNGILQKDTLGRALGGSPNPEFVEWLMAFPTGWTDLEH